MKSLFIFLFFAITLSQGAVIPQQNGLVQAMRSLLQESARVKRDASAGKPINFHFMGVDAEFEFLDEKIKQRGGKLSIGADIERLMYNRNFKNFKFDITFDGGNQVDGLFKLKIDYEFKHYSAEKGTITLETKMVGKEYVLKASVVPALDNFKYLKAMDFEVKTNLMTTLDGTATFDKQTYSLKVFRQPGKQLVATAIGGGHTYKATVDVDMRAQTAGIKLEDNGQQKVKAGISAKQQDNTQEMAAVINIDGIGKMDAKLSVNVATQTVEFETKYNDKVIAMAKGKVILSADKVMMQLKYNVMDGKKEGNIDFGGALQGQIKKIYLNYSPKDKKELDLKVKIDVDTSYQTQTGQKTTILITRNGEKYVNYEHSTVPNMPNKIEERTDIYINDKSVFHNLVCYWQCFNSRQIVNTIQFENLRRDPSRFSYDYQMTTDNVKDLSIEINTRNNPYFIKVVAPKWLPKTLYEQESLELSVDYQPNQLIKIRTNILSAALRPNFWTLVIKKTGNGEERMLVLNDEELGKVDLSLPNKEFRATLKPGNAALFFKWSTNSWAKNNIELTLKSNVENLDISTKLDWDLESLSAHTWKIDLKAGNNKGKIVWFEEGKGSITATKLEDEAKGRIELPIPGHSPIVYDLSIKLDDRNLDYVFKADVNYAGFPINIKFDNGRITVDFP